MCLKYRLGLKLLPVLLLALVFSFSAFSQEATPEQDFLEAAKVIATKYPQTKPLLLKMSESLQKISDKSDKATSALQTTIDRQADTIKTQDEQITSLTQSQKDSEKSHLQVETDLQNYAKSLTTEARVAEVIAIASLIANGIQLIASKK